MSYSSEDYLTKIKFSNKAYDDIQEMYRVFEMHRTNAINQGIRKVFWLDTNEDNYKILSFEPNEKPPRVFNLLGYSSGKRKHLEYEVAVVPIDVVLKYPIIPFCHRLNYKNFHFQNSKFLGLKKKDVGDGIINTYLTFHGDYIGLAYSQIDDKPKEIHKIGIPYQVLYFWKKIYGTGIQKSLF